MLAANVDVVLQKHLPPMRKVLSEEEAMEVIRFYESPVGKKMLAATLNVMAGVVPAVQQRAQEIFQA